MANFDSDDALGDLLSDGSNDSFFEEPKVLAKRASLTKPPDKKSISDLFGLDDEKPNEKLQSKETDWLGLGGSSEEPPKGSESVRTTLTNPDKIPFQSTKPSKKISFDDDDDIFNTLELEKKSDVTAKEPDNLQKQHGPVPTKTESSKKSALMESIFGPPKPQPEMLSSFGDILKESKIGKQKLDQTSIQKVDGTAKVTQQENLGYVPVDIPREGRRSRHQSGNAIARDPLGLFSNDVIGKPSEAPSFKDSSEVPAPGLTKTGRASVSYGEGDAGTAEAEILFPTKHKDLQTKSTTNIKDLPEWLAGGSPVRANKSDTGIRKAEKPEQVRRTSITRKDVDPQKEFLQVAPEDVVDGDVTHVEASLNNPMLESLLAQQKLATSHIGYQNTSIALQQQESQLLVAIQLKKYEENLAEMQRKQQDILVKQEQQFNNLLERQFAKQHIMENNMKLQQERINNHIQLLITQPPISGNTKNVEQEVYENLKKTNADESSRLYEEMIATLKQRQHEEIFLLNESYKKQISLLENSMDSVENRLKTELTNLSEQFHGTIDETRKTHEAEIDKYKQKLQEMSVLHANEIKLIRENHNRIIEEIKYEYSTMVENMKHIKQTESSVLDNANTYSQKLDNNLEILDVNSKILRDIQLKVQQDYGVLSLAREESLKAKEEEINLMRATLEKSREASETDRAQLMGLVRTLEIKIVEQRQNGKDERWALEQAAAVLAARSAAFDRETEFTRASMEREKEQLQTLKETLLAEQEKMMLHLTEEKLLLSAEKSRLETGAKLNQNYDTQRARAEIDAAIEVAKQATELTDRERDNLHKQQSEIEIFKRNLLDRERKLALKEYNLQDMFKTADRKAQDGEKALEEARVLEAKYNGRLRDIQGQLVSLMSREKKLAEEKIALSKERLALHNNLRQVKKCGLCAADNSKLEESNYANDIVEQDFSPRILGVTDPHILRLRYEISEERSLTSRDVDETGSNK